VQRTILIDAVTRHSLGAGVQLIALGDVQFKGKAGAAPVYAVAQDSG